MYRNNQRFSDSAIHILVRKPRDLSMPNVGHFILSVLFLSTLLLIFGCFYVIFKNVAANSVCYHFLSWSDKCSLHNMSTKCWNLVQIYFPNSNFLLLCSGTVVFKTFRSSPIVHEYTATRISRSKNRQLGSEWTSDVLLPSQPFLSNCQNFAE